MSPVFFKQSDQPASGRFARLKQLWRWKRSVIAGGCLAAAVVVLSLFNSLFRGAGTPADGEMTAMPVPRKNTAEKVVSSKKTTQPDRVVYVVIDGEQYLLREGPAVKPPYEPIKLPRLIELAEAARGNEVGVKVDIACRATSIPLSENLLKERLLEAGLPAEAIHWREQTAP